MDIHTTVNKQKQSYHLHQSCLCHEQRQYKQALETPGIFST